ncbi:MAG TPA: hypothetical protein PLQ41_07875 [bacterium]|nr:hypothetical protein [bacterium]
MEEIKKQTSKNDLREFIEASREHEAEFQGKKIIFKPLNSSDALIFLDLLISGKPFTDIIQNNEFIRIASVSLEVDQDDFKKTSPAFKIFVLNQLLEIGGYDFFWEQVKKTQEKVAEMMKRLGVEV